LIRGFCLFINIFLFDFWRWQSDSEFVELILKYLDNWMFLIRIYFAYRIDYDFFMLEF